MIWVLVGVVGTVLVIVTWQVMAGRAAIDRCTRDLAFSHKQASAYLQLCQGLRSIDRSLHTYRVYRAAAIFIATRPSVDVHNIIHGGADGAHMFAALFLNDNERYAQAAAQLDEQGTLPDSVLWNLESSRLREAFAGRRVEQVSGRDPQAYFAEFDKQMTSAEYSALAGDWHAVKQRLSSAEQCRGDLMRLGHPQDDRELLRRPALRLARDPIFRAWFLLNTGQRMIFSSLLPEISNEEIVDQYSEAKRQLALADAKDGTPSELARFASDMEAWLRKTGKMA